MTDPLLRLLGKPGIGSLDPERSGSSISRASRTRTPSPNPDSV